MALVADALSLNRGGASSPEFAGPAHEYPKHIYEPFGAVEARVAWIGREQWPTLGDVLEEARDWYDANASLLKNPTSFPELEARGK